MIKQLWPKVGKDLRVPVVVYTLNKLINQRPFISKDIISITVASWSYIIGIASCYAPSVIREAPGKAPHGYRPGHEDSSESRPASLEENLDTGAIPGIGGAPAMVALEHARITEAVRYRRLDHGHPVVERCRPWDEPRRRGPPRRHPIKLTRLQALAGTLPPAKDPS